ncbi:pro-FMRFamide-related neuropeptide VF [Siniperca chuatsi]|uniref:pro-FMRFamide-related neuropeptide VF n=1 Tax=Siniperca chuatsi TaxID=119488 RepID=UPI001CE1D517|nr:pro-FMRFamide-related neuropeptide VF [Siniperca chuatsi]
MCQFGHPPSSRVTGDVCIMGSLITGDRVVGRKLGMCPGAVLREGVSPAVNMLTAVFLSTLLMLGGLGGAAASDLQVYGKSIHTDKTLLSSDDGRHTVKKQPHQQTKSEIRRSLDLDSFNIQVTPATSKISLPIITKLYAPTAQPLHRHSNMPMRFGRDSNPGDDRFPNSTPNMPQRFGRSWEEIKMCPQCPGVRKALSPVLPERFGKNTLHWSLLRTLANAQLFNTGLHWADDFDFTASSEEVEMQEKTFKGRKRST